MVDGARYGVLDHVPLGIAVVDEGYGVEFWNACLEDWTGVRRADILGQRLDERFPHLKEPRYSARLSGLFEGSAPAVFSSQLHPHFIPARLRSGRLRVQHTVGVPLPGAPGTTHLLLAIEDVTNLADAVQARRLAEQRYRSIAEDQTEMIARWRPDGTRTYANDSYCRFLGLPREVVVGSNLLEPMSRGDRRELEALIGGLTPDGPLALQEGESSAGEGGEPRWTAWTHRALFTELGQVTQVQSVGRDITDRKLAEEALRESEERFRSMAEMAPAAIFIHDGTRLRFANAATVALSGRLRDEVSTDIWSTLHPESREATRERILGHLRGEDAPGRFEIRIGRQGGEERWVDLSAGRLTLEGKPAFVGVGLDITQRKELERFKDGLISMAAHELRNPLTAILNTLEWLASREEGMGSEEQELIGIAKRNSERMARLIDDVLDVEQAESGRIVFDPRPLDLQSLVEQALAANEGYARGLDVSLELSEGLPGARVRGDSDRILQVLANLISNASKYSPAGETVTLAVTRRGSAVRVTVSDRGPGIAEALRPHVFEKFEHSRSQNPRQKGTGLGLAICKSLIEAQGGRIGFDSAIGQGARFYFELPELPEGE